MPLPHAYTSPCTVQLRRRVVNLASPLHQLNARPRTAGTRLGWGHAYGGDTLMLGTQLDWDTLTERTRSRKGRAYGGDTLRLGTRVGWGHARTGDTLTLGARLHRGHAYRGDTLTPGTRLGAGR